MIYGVSVRAAGWSKYESNFVHHGFDSYDDIVKITEADLLATGVKDVVAANIANSVKTLREISEEEAIRELSVSISSVWLIIVGL